MDNAIKFTKRGVVLVKLENTHFFSIRISIRDSGKGLDQGMLKDLFSKFTPLSAGGTGLGLFICKRIVDAHGGRIWAENNVGSIGSTFYFELPIAVENHRQSSVIDKPTKVLLVDDDPVITAVFKQGLETHGFQADVFNDPVEALANFEASRYSLLLIDVRMPKMNGFELYKEMEKIDAVKVCFVTAFEVYYEALKEVFPNMEVECFIRKPIEIADLIKRVDEELEAPMRHRKLDQNEPGLNTRKISNEKTDRS